MANQKSLVLVTVDCLRADHTGFMGYKRPTTPFLDSLAADSFVFPAAIVAGAPTYYSFPAIHASRYPLALGRDIVGVGPGETTLASTLRDFGYVSAAFSAANPYVAGRFGYDHGFDTFQDFLSGELNPLSNETSVGETADSRLSQLNRRIERLAHAIGPLGRLYDGLYFQYCQRWATARPQSLDELRRFPAADVIVTQALEWLSSRGKGPFFLWLHLMDPHSPYYPTEQTLALMATPITPFRARYLNSMWNRGDLSTKTFFRYRESVVQLYDAGVRWVDTQVERLVRALHQLGRWDDCVFAFTADHGEEFLDHGGRYHPPSRLMEEVVHVPLLLRVPGAPKRELTKSPFSHLHLAPTLLDVLQFTPPAAFRGRSLWKQIQQGAAWDDPAIAECVAGCTNPFFAGNRLGPRVLVVRGTRYKLHLHFDSPSEAVYDLLSDPHERSPLPPDAEKQVQRRLLEFARAHFRSTAKELDADLRLKTRLRELQLECSLVPCVARATP
jgi:arylsulfatase A-like enzyme